MTRRRKGGGGFIFLLRFSFASSHPLFSFDTGQGRGPSTRDKFGNAAILYRTKATQRNLKIRKIKNQKGKSKCSQEWERIMTGCAALRVCIVVWGFPF